MKLAENADGQLRFYFRTDLRNTDISELGAAAPSFFSRRAVDWYGQKLAVAREEYVFKK